MDFSAWIEWFQQNVAMDYEFYGNPVRRWMFASAVVVVAFAALRIVVGVLRRRAEHYSQHGLKSWLRGMAVVLKQTKLWFLFTTALWWGSLLLLLPPGTRNRIDSLAIIILLIQAAVWGTYLITFLIERNLEKRLEKDAASVTTMSALGFVGKLVLYTVVLMLVLENLGVNVSALVAGLGVGGIAVALAAQNILGDLFASLSIVLDKPFVFGDFIIVGDSMGTVEKIGLKTTRVRSLSGEQLIIANNDLLQSRIRNFKRMAERRVVFSIGVTYDTPPDKLQALPEMIRNAVEACDNVRFDRAHFAKFGDFALIFEVVYYVLGPDYALYMDIQQQINLDLFRTCADQNIDFAFPTQTLHLHHETTPGSAEA